MNFLVVLRWHSVKIMLSARAFRTQYLAMNRADCFCCDKYFHCLGNYNAVYECDGDRDLLKALAKLMRLVFFSFFFFLFFGVGLCLFKDFLLEERYLGNDCIAKERVSNSSCAMARLPETTSPRTCEFCSHSQLLSAKQNLLLYILLHQS